MRRRRRWKRKVTSLYSGQRGSLLLAHHQRHHSETPTSPSGQSGQLVFISEHLVVIITLQDQVSSLIRDVRSSRIFDSNFEAGRSFDSDFLPTTGMQKSCTASSIADLGESSQQAAGWEKQRFLIYIFRERESGERRENRFG